MRVGDAPASHSADVLALPHAAVAPFLTDLQSVGLITTISGDPPRYAPTPPDVGFAPLLREGMEALDRARSTINELTDEHRAAIRRRDAKLLVEVITGTDAIRQQVRNLQLSTQSEMLWFCRAGHVAMAPSDNTEEFEMLASGVSYNVRYEQALLEEPGMVDSLAQGIWAGEVARAAPSLPCEWRSRTAQLRCARRFLAVTGSANPLPHSCATATCSPRSSTATGQPPHLCSPSPTRRPVCLPKAPPPTRSPTRPEPWCPPCPRRQRQGHRHSPEHERPHLQRRISEVMALTHAHTRMQLAWQVSRRGWLDITKDGHRRRFRERTRGRRRALAQPTLSLS